MIEKMQRVIAFIEHEADLYLDLCGEDDELYMTAFNALIDARGVMKELGGSCGDN